MIDQKAKFVLTAIYRALCTFSEVHLEILKICETVCIFD